MSMRLVPTAFSEEVYKTPFGVSQESQIVRNQSRSAELESENSPASRDVNQVIEDPLVIQLQVAKACLRAALESFDNHLPQDTCQKIDQRLSILLDPDEWEEDNHLPEIRSFVLMIKFLSEHPEFRPPSMFLTQHGFFDASWRRSANELVALEFHPDQKIGWLIFNPDPHDPEDSEEAAGRAAGETVIRRLQEQGALRWVRRDAPPD